MANMKITAIDPDSPLAGHIAPGFEVVSVNGEPVEDAIDFRFQTADEPVLLVLTDTDGVEHEFEFETGEANDLGLTFDDGEVKRCRCNCIFCFVRQQPKGMRPALYVKDEDYRLSFTHGNFITLSNTTDEDMERIVRQRLSPLYISVHATDDKLRREILRNKKLAPVMERVEYLVKNGVEVHTQVVLLPGINDGEVFAKTVDDLAGLHPGVVSLAAVPVGLTRYRENLPKLRIHTPDEAGTTIDQVEGYQRGFLRTLGTRFVWAADEFYVQAERAFPSLSSYEDMPQFENGVGMVRDFVTGFNRRRASLRGLKSKRRVLFLTGESARPLWNQELLPYLTEKIEIDLKVQPVLNRFWGESVTVSGLLTGQDLLRAAREAGNSPDTVVLPPNCLNEDNLFLDNMSLTQFRQTLEREVVVGSYDLARTIREVFV
jgi:putative radical SAM enzyme (TIGR03279 family)